MIDVHCHVLPGLDDGARDLADALAMVRIAHADGIRAICATPHVRDDHDVDLASLTRRRAALQAAIDVDVEILPGGEVAEPLLRTLSEAELRGLTLGGGGRWILLEPARGPLSDALVAAVDHLAELGLGAVIAHPERHYAHDLLERLRALHDHGALLQVTAAYAGEGWMQRLYDEGLVDLLGTDAHTSHGGRRLELSPAVAALREHAPGQADRIAFENPARVIAGDAVN